MAPLVRTCSSCDTPLPAGTSYCHLCGAATPTEIVGETSEIQEVELTDFAEVEYRARLQHALGEDYELRDVIGRGGFGTVYAAWDVKLEREVAVKAIRHDLFATPALLARFEREAKVVAKLRHPNILPIYTVGQGEGIAFMVMPKVDGESLRDVLNRDDTLPVAEAIRILSGAADALGAAHEAGVIHRDVKPENIMLEGRNRRVLLMDFGIAKPADASAMQLTATDVVIGTPHYMSPEQATGERNVDHRSDVFSLGVVGYQMLTGRRPFDGENARQVITELLTAEPAPVTEIMADVPPEAANIIHKCLAKDTEKRWQTAAELSAALRTFQAVGEALPRREAWFDGLLLGGLAPVLYLFSLLGVSVEVTLDRVDPLTAYPWLVVSDLFRGTWLFWFLVALPVVVAGATAFRRGIGLRHFVTLVLRQPRWWTGWYPRALSRRRTIWPRLPWPLKWHHTVINLSVLYYLLVAMPMMIMALSLGDAASRYYAMDIPIVRSWVGVNASWPDAVSTLFNASWFETWADNILSAAVTIGYLSILVWLKRKGLRLGEAHAVAGGRALRRTAFSLLFWKRHKDASWLTPPPI